MDAPNTNDEFDDGFQVSLMQTISSNQLPADICQVLRLDNQSRAIKNNRLRGFIYAFNRLSLTWYCDFLRINLLNDRRTQPANKLTLGQKLKQLAPGSARSTTKKWPYVILFVFIITSSVALFNTYYQYIYDANIAKSNKLKQLIRNDMANESLVNRMHFNVNKLLDDWGQRASEARKTLKLVGASHLEWSFVTEAMVLIGLLPSILQIIVFPLVYKLSNMIMMLPKAIIDKRNEHQARARLIVSELNKFSADCLAFARTKLEEAEIELDATLDLLAIHEDQLKSLRHKALSLLALKLRQRHKTIIEQLKEMSLEGRFNHLNGTPACQDQVALIYFLGFILMNFYMQLAIAFSYNLAACHFRRQGKLVELNNFKDILDAINLLMIGEFSLNSALVLLVICSVVIFDQIKQITRLRTIVLYVIEENELKFHLMMQKEMHRSRNHQHNLSIVSTISLSEYPSTRPTIRRQQLGKTTQLVLESIELDLLMLIMQSRLVSRSFHYARKPLDSIAILLLYFTIATPLILRIHSTYFDRELRDASSTVALGTVALSLALMIPLGMLHQRSLKTYESFWSLVAQLSHFDSLTSANKSPRVDLSVAASTLRRELADSRETTDKLACRFCAIPITYNNLIRIFIWVFLLMISQTNNVNLFGDALNQFIQDPFGLFKFLASEKV